MTAMRTGDAEPSNRELLDHIQRIEAWQRDHDGVHRALESWRSDHTADSRIRDREIQEFTPDVKAAHDLAVRLDTITGLVKYATGGSLLAAIAAVASLVMILAHVANATLP